MNYTIKVCRDFIEVEREGRIRTFRVSSICLVEAKSKRVRVEMSSPWATEFDFRGDSAEFYSEFMAAMRIAPNIPVGAGLMSVAKAHEVR